MNEIPWNGLEAKTPNPLPLNYLVLSFEALVYLTNRTNDAELDTHMDMSYTRRSMK